MKAWFSSLHWTSGPTYTGCRSHLVRRSYFRSNDQQHNYRGHNVDQQLDTFWISLFFGATAPSGPGPPHFTRFLDHTQRRTTVGRTPLDEWSARRRDLYLTTHNTHNRQTSMILAGFETTISAGERPLPVGYQEHIKRKKNFCRPRYE